MKPTSNQKFPYISKGLKISKSLYHKDTYLVTEESSGRGFSIASSDDVIVTMHPPDREKKTVIRKPMVELKVTLGL